MDVDRCMRYLSKRTHCSTLQHTATHCKTLQHTSTRMRCHFKRVTATLIRCHFERVHVLLSLDYTISSSQHIATHCNTLQHTVTHCNILHHICVATSREAISTCKSVFITQCTLLNIERQPMQRDRENQNLVALLCACVQESVCLSTQKLIFYFTCRTL